MKNHPSTFTKTAFREFPGIKEILCIIALCCCLFNVRARADDALYTNDFHDATTLGTTLVGEGGNVEIKDGRLMLHANPGPGDKYPNEAGVWIRQPFSGNLAVEFTATALSAARNATDLQFFLYFTTTQGEPITNLLKAGRLNMGILKAQQGLIAVDFADTAERDGKILTGTVVNTPSRFRTMVCPGGKQLSNTWAGAYEVGKTYAIRIEYNGRHLRYLIDGALMTEADDPGTAPRSGEIGIRSWMNDLAIGNLVVKSLQ